jgi:hypothetical protein
MRIETLPSPGLLSNSIELRAAAARAISNIETTAGRSGGVTSGANSLHSFFTACAAAVASMRDLVVPTVTARNQTTGANVVRLTTSEGLDPTVIPALTSFVTAPARTITAIEVQGNQLLVTYSGASLASGNTIAYTAPGTNALRDPAGNLLATFAAQAIVVA